MPSSPPISLNLHQIMLKPNLVLFETHLSHPNLIPVLFIYILFIWGIFLVNLLHFCHNFYSFLISALIWPGAAITILCKNSICMVSVLLSWSFSVKGKKISHFQFLSLFWTLGENEEWKSCPCAKGQALFSGNKWSGGYSGLIFRVLKERFPSHSWYTSCFYGIQ